MSLSRYNPLLCVSKLPKRQKKMFLFSTINSLERYKETKKIK